MAKKKVKEVVEKKPTAAKFLLTMEELDRRLRRSIGGFRAIAVKLPKHLNTSKWVKENFPFNKGIQDIVMWQNPDNVFLSQQIREAVKEPRTCNQRTAPLMALNRYCYVIKLTRESVEGNRAIPFKENNVLFYFYTDDEEDVTNPHTFWRQTFHNRMHYNEEFHALVIDRWDSIPNYVNHYIALNKETV